MRMLDSLSVPVLSPALLRTLAPLTLVMVICVLGTGTLYGFRLGPAQERVRNAEQGYHTEKDAQTQLKFSRRQFEKARAVRRQLDALWNTLPAQHEFAPFALAVSELGRAEGVVIPGMTYEVQKGDLGLPVKASVSFTVRGEYAALYRFIHRLETSESYINIEHLDVTRHSTSGPTRTRVIEFQLRVGTFLRPNPPTPRMS